MVAALKFRSALKIKPVLHLLRDSCEYVRSVKTRVFPKFYKSPTRRLSLATRLTVDPSQHFDWDVERDERGVRRIYVFASGIDGIEKGDQIRAVVVGDHSSPFGKAVGLFYLPLYEARYISSESFSQFDSLPLTLFD